MSFHCELPVVLWDKHQKGLSLGVKLTSSSLLTFTAIAFPLEFKFTRSEFSVICIQTDIRH